MDQQKRGLRSEIVIGSAPIPFEVDRNSPEYRSFLVSMRRTTPPKTERNSPCHCGSGIKFKKCCGK